VLFIVPLTIVAEYSSSSSYASKSKVNSHLYQSTLSSSHDTKSFTFSDEMSLPLMTMTLDPSMSSAVEESDVNIDTSSESSLVHLHSDQIELLSHLLSALNTKNDVDLSSIAHDDIEQLKALFNTMIDIKREEDKPVPVIMDDINSYTVTSPIMEGPISYPIISNHIISMNASLSIRVLYMLL